MNRALLCRTQYLTMKCVDKATTFNSYDLNSTRALECEEDEAISVQLQTFSMDFTNYLINSTNNSFLIGGKNYSIPPGSGYYTEQANQFTGMSSGITCNYNTWSNIFVWTNANGLTITFTGGAIWGLPDNFTTNSASFTSTAPLTLLSPNNIVIRENTLSKQGDNYELLNFADGGVSNIFHIISFSYAAHTSFTYNNEHDSYEHLLTGRTVDRMNFDITDFYGNNIPWITNYFATIRVRVYKKYNFFENELLKLMKANWMVTRKHYHLAGHKYEEKILSKQKEKENTEDGIL